MGDGAEEEAINSTNDILLSSHLPLSPDIVMSPLTS
jgi:hypothetical protein